jgi:REP element-mobilizing transposase RayT
MTNHIHLIVIPKTKESLSKAIGETHRLYTNKFNVGDTEWAPNRAIVER